MTKLRTIDLFAGIGGFRLAFEAAGFQTVFANDNAKRCEEIYNRNFNIPHLTLRNISDVQVDAIPEFDVLTGGFPCQPYSCAGKRMGMNDERSSVVGNIFSILDHHQPKAFLLENVKQLLTNGGGVTLNNIQTRLKELHYFTKTKVLDTAQYANIPQHRERLFLVGFSDMLAYEKFDFPSKLELDHTFKDYLQRTCQVDSCHYLCNVKGRYRSSVREAFDAHFKYDRNIPLAFRLKNTYLRSFKTLGIVPTITSTFGSPVILDDKDFRRLTVKECFNLQGFPETYKIPEKMSRTTAMALIGNSVTVPLITRIANHIQKALVN